MTAEKLELTPEQKRDRFEKRAKLALMLGAGLLFAPIALATIGGLIGLIVATALAIFGINAAPVFSRKMANWKMGQLMAEARKRPIETMMVIYAYNMDRIRQRDQRLREMAASLEDFKSKARGFAKKWPDKAPVYDEMIAKMTMSLNKKLDKQKTAKAAAIEYHAKIDEAQDTYEMAKAARGLQELDSTTEAEINNEIQQKVAFDSVSHEFNLAVSDLVLDVDTDPTLGVREKDLKMLAATPETVPPYFSDNHHDVEVRR